MEDFEIEIKKTFLEEATSTLEETESAFLELENNADKTESLNSIFRMAHSFKGSAKAVGFEEVSRLAHKMEDLLVLIQSNNSLLSSVVINVLLKTVDVLKIMINGLKSDLNFTHPIEDIVNELVQIKNNPTIGVENNSVENSSAKELSEFENKELLAELQNSFLENTSSSTSTIIAINNNSNTTTASSNNNFNSNKVTNTKNADEESLRVSVKKLDTLLNFVGELVVQKSIMDQKVKEGLSDISESISIISYMSKLVSEVQQISMSLRMVPMKPLFQRLKRTLRDVALEQQKDVLFESDGEDVELDKLILDKVIDPLTHIIRNAVDHGLETNEERIQLNKKEQAKVSLVAIQEDNVVKIIITDNGKGLNKNKILEKAIKNKLINELSAQTLPESEIFKLIFKPGFSTKEVVTEISGRGVGMDVVLQAVNDLKGNIQINSVEGQGSRFEISIPLSHAILGGITIFLDETKYIVPLPHLVETISFNNIEIHKTKNNERVINLRNEIIPVFNLSEALKNGSLISKNKKVYGQGIIVQFENQKYCFEIDFIIGQQEVVIKKIGQEIGALPGIIGAGIIGSGEVSLILNLKDFCSKGAMYGRLSA